MAAPEAWLLVVPLLAGLALAVVLVGRRSVARVERALRPATLAGATSRALYAAMTPFHRLEQTEPEAVPTTPGARVRLADAAGRLYDALPDTITVRYAGRLVPVPLKTILGRQEAVNALSAAFWGDTAGVGVVDGVLAEAFRVAALRGITEERLVGYGVPLDAPSSPGTAPPGGRPTAPS